jgi:hypothetical protein
VIVEGSSCLVFPADWPHQKDCHSLSTSGYSAFPAYSPIVIRTLPSEAPTYLREVA